MIVTGVHQQGDPLLSVVLVPPIPTETVPLLLGLLPRLRAPGQILPPEKLKRALRFLLNRVLLLPLPSVVVPPVVLGPHPQVVRVKELLLLQPLTALLTALVLAPILLPLVLQSRAGEVGTLPHPPVTALLTNGLTMLPPLVPPQRVHLGLQLNPRPRRNTVQKQIAPIRVMSRHPQVSPQQTLVQQIARPLEPQTPIAPRIVGVLAVLPLTVLLLVLTGPVHHRLRRRLETREQKETRLHTPATTPTVKTGVSSSLSDRAYSK